MGEWQPVAIRHRGSRCEMCATPIAEEGHDHVADLRDRRLLCTCRGCFLLFTPEGAGGSRYRAVPDRHLALPDLDVSPGQWDALQIPVSVAFFFESSEAGRTVAFYPSPAGATESLLPLDAWAEVVAAHPTLPGLLPDVEAFLVRRDRAAGRTEVFLVPIDVCYELVGTLRQHWRGFDGGSEAHAALDDFFAGVAARAEVVA